MEEDILEYQDVYAFTQIPFMGLKVDVIVFCNHGCHAKYVKGAKDGSWHRYPYKVDLRRGGRKDGQDKFGRLGFLPNTMNIRVVNHEITHMVMDYLSMMEWDLENDEPICEAVGEFSRDLYNFYWNIQEE